MSRLRDAIGRFLFEGRSAETIALVRILVGTVLLISQLAMLPDVAIFYSDEGVVPNPTLSVHQPDPHWSLLHLIGDPVAVRLVHLLYLAVIVCVLLGYRTGPATVLLFFLAVSFRFRNPLVTNSGDQLLTIVAFWLMFARSGAAWSLDARQGRTGPAWDRTWVLRTLQLQLCLVYLASLVHKLGDPDWRSGQTMFYVAALVYDWWVPWTGLMDRPVLYVGITYATLAFELAFPLLIWRGSLRLPLRIVAALFHACIALFLGLPTFSGLMIALGFLFVSRRELDLLAARLDPVTRPR